MLRSGFVRRDAHRHAPCNLVPERHMDFSTLLGLAWQPHHGWQSNNECKEQKPMWHACHGCGQALGQAAQGGGGVAIPGGVQNSCGSGTSGHGLAGMVVVGGWLDLRILEVFSNLWFYDSSEETVNTTGIQRLTVSSKCRKFSLGIFSGQESGNSWYLKAKVSLL